MPDKITACNAIRNSQNELLRYDVAYDLFYEDEQNHILVRITLDELTDPLNIAEVIEKANTRAKIVKDEWISAIPQPAVTPIPDVVGDVVLT